MEAMKCHLSWSLGTILILLVGQSQGFSHYHHNHVGRIRSTHLAPSSRLDMAAEKSVIVVSPPGGIGEVAAVKAACLGNSVRWFIISKDTESSSVTMSPQAMREVSDANGSLAVAGSSVDNLMTGGDAVVAVSKWCSTADGIVCSYDGCNADKEIKAAILVAADEAAKGVNGARVAVLGADEDLMDSEEKDTEEGLGSLVRSLFGGATKGPSSLAQALGGEPSIVRHGELFGTPESSPDFSPLVGGPRVDPVITEEYTMRNVRVDPFVVSGNVMASSSRRACRHAVGEVAALLATGTLKPVSEDISISSQVGTDGWALDQWESEFERVRELVASGKASTLFSQEMIVDNTERLADWLAAKWAPAVMRTYDIAAIRVGARPVFAMRPEESKVDIIWQELVNFETNVVGKMRLEVNTNGIIVTREAGDASKGYGSVSKRPLPGEDVLVRRLADAVSQSIEKGLAKKIAPKKQSSVEPVEAAPVSSLQSAGPIETTETNSKANAEAGPRGTGARRSTPRTRRGSSKSS